MSYRPDERLDKAARAGWLYYIAGNSQDEIARKMGVSRQSAQRLVSTALDEKLVKFRLDHPLGNCMELAAQMTERFGLKTCEIAPSDPTTPDLITGVAIAGAGEMKRHLDCKTRKVIAVGTGILPWACVEQFPPIDCPQHHIVSMVGNMHRDGSATAYNVVERLAHLVGSQHNPMPMPVLVRNSSELSIFHKLEAVAQTLDLCKKADATFVGLAHIDKSSPMVRDGFISIDESKDLIKRGAIGEIVGWVFDTNGALIPGTVNERVSSAPLIVDNPRPVVGLAIGIGKVRAIIGALRGGLINGLVTDEATAMDVLEKG